MRLIRKSSEKLAELRLEAGANVEAGIFGAEAPEELGLSPYELIEACGEFAQADADWAELL